VNRELLITRVTRVEAHCGPGHWRWAQDNREAIAAHWAKRTADKPQMFNGRVLLINQYDFTEGAFHTRYFEVDFADFLAWRDFGYPDATVANGFAMGALQGSDGAFICGVMGQHTANAGRVYFPAGTPDRSDLRPDGTVDLSTSVLRELAEETSLPSDSYRVADDWVVVRQWPSIAFLRPIVFTEPADVIARRIEANIVRQKEPELAGTRVIRNADDIDPSVMPIFLQSFFRWAFAADQR